MNLKQDQEVINTYVEYLIQSIHELRTAYSALLDRIEDKLLNVLSIDDHQFVEYQEIVQRRFKEIQADLLLPRQKTFYKRVMSPLDDRDSWLKSISDVLIGKNINEMRDEEEAYLMAQLEGMLKDLEKLIGLHTLKQERMSDEIFRFEVLDPSGAKKNETIILPA